MDAKPASSFVLQRFSDELRTEMGTADADMDDIPDRVASTSPPLAPANGIGKFLHPFQNRSHRRHHVPTIDPNRLSRKIPQGDMEDRPIFGLIDSLTLEHPADWKAEAGGLKWEVIGHGNHLGHEAEWFVNTPEKNGSLIGTTGDRRQRDPANEPL